MLKRKIMNDLIAWKHAKNHQCLLIKGCRQTGKTYIVNEFAKQHYKNYIYINFDESPAYKEIFSDNLDIETLMKQITLRIPGSKLVPNETIIFLDEIQNCPNARTSLKFFALDGRFDVVASGSLLGINYKEVPSFPVGYVKHLEMHSLDFEEYLWANGIDEHAVGMLKEYFDRKERIPDAIHQSMMKLFKEYIVIGGMPKVVSTFIKNLDFHEALELQQGIIQDYLDDIAKYANGTEKAKARACFLSIPKHLSKDYKKFRYSIVERNGNARKYGGSLMWLYDAGIINFAYNLTVPERPLEGNAKSDVFKVYMRDTGLLMAMLEEGSQEDIIDGNLGIYKGAIYENIIADIFTKLGKKLYYFEYNSQLEIDFFIRYEKELTAIEVKSADNTKSKSLQTLMNKWKVQKAIRLSTKNIGYSNQILSIPLYMSIFL